MSYGSTAILDSNYFTFTKTAVTDGGQEMDAWSCEETAATVVRAATPQIFSMNAYPNPFNPTTNLTFTLPYPAQVSLEVFDINGRSVGAQGIRLIGSGSQGARSAPQQQTWYDSGIHTIPFDGSDLPSGIYFARLTAGDHSTMRKLVLMK
ncbi:MAG: T9SS type A sorting domain-containing protein [bacterium]|nr:T9SS type A sorting domain-containing protein [bacterium]